MSKKQSMAEMSQVDLAKRADYLAGAFAKMRAEVVSLGAQNGAGFEIEYESLKDVGMQQASKTSALPKNESLNRYRNIQAYDHSRVTVSELKSDYINGNWIPGQKNRKQYVATQGPVPDSFASFWQMIWEHNVRMLCCASTRSDRIPTTHPGRAHLHGDARG